ncbi:Transmembrane protein 130, partial [Galemys pyrenaicus]
GEDEQRRARTFPASLCGAREKRPLPLGGAVVGSGSCSFGRRDGRGRVAAPQPHPLARLPPALSPGQGGRRPLRQAAEGEGEIGARGALQNPVPSPFSPLPRSRLATGGVTPLLLGSCFHRQTRPPRRTAHGDQGNHRTAWGPLRPAALLIPIPLATDLPADVHPVFFTADAGVAISMQPPACLALANAPGLGDGQEGGLYELRLTTDGPATTGTEVSITASLVASDNGSLVLPSDTHSYHFRWIHTPLLLTGKTDEALSSTIRAVGNAPGDFPVSVWVTAANCWMCRPVARSFLVLPITEFLVGKLVVTQNTSLPWPSSYLTKTVLKVSFLLHDPRNFFKTASFLYSWDFGDGTQMVTADPDVYYNYSNTGTFTVKLKVVVEWEQAKPDGGKGILQKTGDFSTTVKLQETLQGIQVLGPTLIQTFQKMTVTLNFLGRRLGLLHPLMDHSSGLFWNHLPCDSPKLCFPGGQREGTESWGCWHQRRTWSAHTAEPCLKNASFPYSPPLTVCWRLKPECLPLEEGECHSVSVANTAYNLTHIFRDPGDYCFSIRAENVISRTHQYHRIQVWPSNLQPAVFAFPCATLITMMLAFLLYVGMRNNSQQKDMVENPEPSSGPRCCCQVCCGPFALESPSEYLEVVRENQCLLPPLYKSVKMYTV